MEDRTFIVKNRTFIVFFVAFFALLILFSAPKTNYPTTTDEIIAALEESMASGEENPRIVIVVYHYSQISEYQISVNDKHFSLLNHEWNKKLRDTLSQVTRDNPNYVNGLGSNVGDVKYMLRRKKVAEQGSIHAGGRWWHFFKTQSGTIPTQTYILNDEEHKLLKEKAG